MLISDKENVTSPLDMEEFTLKKEESAESETMLYVETMDQVKQSIKFSEGQCDQLEEEEDQFYKSFNLDSGNK